jgi:hypothetical protein
MFLLLGEVRAFNISAEDHLDALRLDIPAVFLVIARTSQWDSRAPPSYFKICQNPAVL